MFEAADLGAQAVQAHYLCAGTAAAAALIAAVREPERVSAIVSRGAHPDLVVVPGARHLFEEPGTLNLVPIERRASYVPTGRHRIASTVQRATRDGISPFNKGSFCMKRTGMTVVTVFVCAFVSAVQAFAADAPAAVRQEVAVLAGGIGDDELQALRAREKEFNLKLVFSLVQGNYLADVDVVVADQRATTILERPNTGPILLARLPAGEYNITVTHDGKAVSRKVRIVTGRLRTEHVVRWPANPEQDLPVSRWIDRE